MEFISLILPAQEALQKLCKTLDKYIDDHGGSHQKHLCRKRSTGSRDGGGVTADGVPAGYSPIQENDSVWLYRSKLPYGHNVIYLSNRAKEFGSINSRPIYGKWWGMAV